MRSAEWWVIFPNLILPLTTHTSRQPQSVQAGNVAVPRVAVHVTAYTGDAAGRGVLPEAPRAPRSRHVRGRTGHVSGQPQRAVQVGPIPGRVAPEIEPLVDDPRAAGTGLDAVDEGDDPAANLGWGLAVGRLDVQGHLQVAFGRLDDVAEPIRRGNRVIARAA